MKDRFSGTVLAASLGFGLVQLDVSIVNVALVTMARDLGVGTPAIAWIVDAYVIAFASTLLFAGALGDRLGAKRVFIAGFAMFGIASIGCALAPTFAILAGMRVLQGIGASALVPCSLGLIAHAAGNDSGKRAWAIGVWTAAGSVSLAVGPIAGGALVATLGWRSIFFINLPICAAAMWLTQRMTRETETRSGSFDPRVLLGFFRDRAFGAAVGVGFAINASLYGTLFMFAIYLQHSRGYSPLDVGLALLPFAIALGISNVAAGPLIGKHGTRFPMLAGLSVAFAGFAMLLVCGAQTAYVTMVPALVAIPLGIGIAVPAMTSALLGTIPRSRSGLASGVLNTVRQAAGALGIAVAAAAIARVGSVAGLHVLTALCLAAIGVAIGLAMVGIPGLPRTQTA
jgi:DHA2 family methylenomycin A resistance protein-like MFS transporter